MSARSSPTRRRRGGGERVGESPGRRAGEAGGADGHDAARVRVPEPARPPDGDGDLGGDGGWEDSGPSSAGFSVQRVDAADAAAEIAALLQRHAAGAEGGGGADNDGDDGRAERRPGGGVAAPSARAPLPVMLITGIGGFIGRAVAERALARGGHRVRGVDADSERVAAVAEELHGVDVVTGSVTDAALMASACEGVSVVVHTAALVHEDAPLAAARRVNVDGTRTVARAARQAGVRWFVHISSVAVYGFAYPRHVDEGAPLLADRASRANTYCVTKAAAERAALAEHAADGGAREGSGSGGSGGDMQVVVLRPGNVYGPRSVPWVVRPLRMAQRGMDLLLFGGGHMAHTFVGNLVDAVFACMTDAAAGGAFNITDGDDACTWGDYWAALYAAASFPPPPHPAAWPLLWLGARYLGLLRRLGWFDAGVGAESLRFASTTQPYSIARARSTFGYAPRVTLTQGMDETQKWLVPWLRAHPYPAGGRVSPLYLALPVLLVLASLLTLWLASVLHARLGGGGGGGRGFGAVGGGEGEGVSGGPVPSPL